MSVQISIFFRPYQIPKGQPLSVCTDVARVMDEVGIHSIIFGDHLLIGNHPEHYPYGPFQHNQQAAWTEPLLTLAAIAGATKNLLLAAGVLLTPLRAPLLLAKSIATLDVMSNGRTQLAIGTGWQREEYEALGLDWAERYKRLDEGIRACRAIWGEQPVSFESENTHIDRAWILPRPIQERVPLLYGVAMTPRHARRIAELGDGWFPVGHTPRQIREGVDILKDALKSVGRDINQQHIRVGITPQLDKAGKIDIPKSLSIIPDYQEAGANIFQINTPAEPESLHEIYEFIEGVARSAEALG